MERFIDSDQDSSANSFKENFGFDPNEPDTDGDGLPDFLEKKLGLDLNKPDTDGDGKGDFQELRCYCYLGTDLDECLAKASTIVFYTLDSDGDGERDPWDPVDNSD